MSSDIPAEAVLKFSVILSPTVGVNKPAQKFTCRTSTFLTLPAFRFAFHNSDDSIQELPLDLALTEGTFNTSYGRLSKVWKHGGEAERSLELNPTHNITHITCMVYQVKSNQWINETLELLVLHTDKNGKSFKTQK